MANLKKIDKKIWILEYTEKCIANRVSIWNVLCTNLSFTSNSIVFKITFHTIFSIKLMCNFWGFSVFSLNFEIHFKSLNNLNDWPQKYLQIKILLATVTIFFVEKIKILCNFFWGPKKRAHGCSWKMSGWIDHQLFYTFFFFSPSKNEIF